MMYIHVTVYTYTTLRHQWSNLWNYGNLC